MMYLGKRSLTEKAVGSLKKKSHLIIPLIISLIPFLYFFRQIFPIDGKYIAIGNDFDLLYYNYKVYLLDCLSNFHFPLWSPAEAAGFPFYSSPFAAVFYPLNIFLAIFYKVMGGYTRLDHQVFTVFGISIFGLGLYFWLKETTLNSRAIFFAASVMCVSFKVTEIVRFPNAVHTAAWYPWILFCITKILRCQAPRKSFFYGCFLFCLTIFFLTGGYPYYIYYSPFLFIPYIIFLFIPTLRNNLFRFSSYQVIKSGSILVLCLSFFCGCLICSPYLYKMGQLLENTTDRGGNSFEYSTFHVFNFQDTLGSLFFPPMAQAEGWYYFSIFAILTVLLYFLDTIYENLKVIKQSNWRLEINELGYRNFYILLFFLSWIGIISYITYGKESYLFHILWEYMPFFSSLRVWGRMNIILVPIICLLLAMSYQNLEERVFLDKKNSLKKIPNLLFLVCYGLIITAQYFWYREKEYDYYWTTSFTPFESKDIWFIVFSLIAFGVILSLIFKCNKFKFYGIEIFRNKTRSISGILVVLLVFLSVMDMSVIGNKMWAIQEYRDSTWLPEIRLFDTPSRNRLEIPKANLDSFSVPRTEYEHTGISLTSAFNVGIMYNWYYYRYINFLNSAEEDIESRDRLLGRLDGKKIYFSKHIGYSTVKDFLVASQESENKENILTYTGDKLVVEVDMVSPGYVSFIDNWDPDWKATIDGQVATIDKLFGTFKSVYVSEGKHELTFLYSPSFFN